MTLSTLQVPNANTSPRMYRGDSQGSRKGTDSMVVKVARDEDFQQQIGSHQWFDLVDPEKVKWS